MPPGLRGYRGFPGRQCHVRFRPFGFGFFWGLRLWGLGLRVCHSATARPTHEVVVGRAVFVTWNPPTTARSRTRTVLHQPNRRGHRDIRVMCHSSSDVLARPRRPPPESSVESSAPGSAKLFCEWQSRAESPTRGSWKVDFSEGHILPCGF